MAKGFFVADGSGAVKNVTNPHIDVGGSMRNVVGGWVADSSGVPKQFWPIAEPPPPMPDEVGAIWAQTYSGTEHNESSERGYLNYEGHSSYHGNESSLWGFDFTAIRQRLVGREVTRVQARITSRWSYDGGGKTYHIMKHGYTSEPSSITIGEEIATITLPRAGTGYTDLPLSIVDEINNGTVHGIGLRYTDSDTSWGYCTGMYTTSEVVSSPDPDQIIPCPDDQLTKIIFTSTAIKEK